ncbi:hypothetical protein [Mesorhizobium sp. Root157]|uniref:hypothetical protein n=1 Tax=Mesorhizobium sp. Root157 TaxID=1736477 RepID=UPI000B0BF48B|nr:hypothetical protein [Mesorhizobium sp. Root157]
MAFTIVMSAMLVNAVTAAGENLFAGEDAIRCFVRGAFGGLCVGFHAELSRFFHREVSHL